MTRRISAILALALAACSPSDFAAIQTAGTAVGAAIDTFALIRAEQIRAKSRQAELAAASGDTLGAMRALDEALAIVAAKTIEELALVKARCPAPAAPIAAAPLPERFGER